MIQKFIMATATISLLAFTGCSQTAPDLAGKNNVSDATQFGDDTVSIDENRYGNEAAAGSNFNSSSDGFQSIYFGFGDYSISPAMQERIGINANVANKASGTQVKIEGNCDEFGTDEYNYALGLKRANAVRDSIASQGVNTSKMVIVSFGESNPVCNEPTDECYERNRRVDIRLAN